MTKKRRPVTGAPKKTNPSSHRNSSSYRARAPKSTHAGGLLSIPVPELPIIRLTDVWAGNKTIKRGR
jgi:hypothetical protein